MAWLLVGFAAISLSSALSAYTVAVAGNDLPATLGRDAVLAYRQRREATYKRLAKVSLLVGLAFGLAAVLMWGQM